MEMPTLEEIQSLGRFLNEATTPKKDLTQLNLAVDAAIKRKDFNYAFGLITGSTLSQLGMDATEFAEAYLKIKTTFDVELALTIESSKPEYMEGL